MNGWLDLGGLVLSHADRLTAARTEGGLRISNRSRLAILFAAVALLCNAFALAEDIAHGARWYGSAVSLALGVLLLASTIIWPGYDPPDKDQGG